jgi:uncharacterized membrane protein YgcG
MSPARPGHSSSIHVAAYPAFILPFFSSAPLLRPFSFSSTPTLRLVPASPDFFSARKIAPETHASAGPSPAPFLKEGAYHRGTRHPHRIAAIPASSSREHCPRTRCAIAFVTCDRHRGIRCERAISAPISTIALRGSSKRSQMGGRGWRGQGGGGGGGGTAGTL